MCCPEVLFSLQRPLGKTRKRGRRSTGGSPPTRVMLDKGYVAHLREERLHEVDGARGGL